MELNLFATERRRHRRSMSDTVAWIKSQSGTLEYKVRNLSVGGALLTGGPELRVGARIELVVGVPLYPPFRVQGKVVHRIERSSEGSCFGIEFHHQTDVTEDHIQAALLSELERARAEARKDT